MSINNKTEFVKLFATTFLASYAASIYSDCCMTDQHERLECLPVEDALIIAETAYEDLIREMTAPDPNYASTPPTCNNCGMELRPFFVHEC